MKLIAIHTIHGAYTEPVVDDKGAPIKGSRGRDKRRFIDAAIVPPGAEFDSGELSIDDEEVKNLLAAGAVKRKTKEVADDEGDGPVPVAQNTAPAGPASGATKAPDPAAVAKAATARA